MTFKIRPPMKAYNSIRQSDLSAVAGGGACVVVVAAAPDAEAKIGNLTSNASVLP